MDNGELARLIILFIGFAGGSVFGLVIGFTYSQKLYQRQLRKRDFTPTPILYTHVCIDQTKKMNLLRRVK